jgi:two-component system, chemotaxis family, chemotaxis protein CheY
MKILIVDDSKSMRRIVQAMLREAGFRGHDFIEGSDGAEGLKLALGESPDLIISDWNMPNMTGIEMLQKLREAGNQTTLGFVTTEISPDMRALATASGAAFLIGKPFAPLDFEKALGALID